MAVKYYPEMEGPSRRDTLSSAKQGISSISLVDVWNNMDQYRAPEFLVEKRPGHKNSVGLNAGNIPSELKERQQWVNWRFDEGRNGKPTKIPYSPRTSRKASTIDPSTWGTFEEAFAALQLGSYDGVGFVFSSEDPYIGVDLDNCLDAKTDEIDESAQAWIERLNSYTEVSPSGSGVHIILKGQLPKRGRRTTVNGKAVEVYSEKRFFTFTGVCDAVKTIQERSVELDALVNEYFANSKANRNGTHQSNGEGKPGLSNLTDNALLEKLFGEKRHGEKWRAVHNGNYHDYYPSPSEAVAAFLRKCAFYSGRDQIQMERIIRGSGLDSEKYDSSRGDSTWLQREIASAIEDTTETYSPSPKSEKRQNKRRDESTIPIPTHDELTDRWIEQNRNYVYGLGEWRRYEGGIWSAVNCRLVKRGITEVLKEAKAEGIKPTRSLLDSVHGLAEIERYIEDHRWDSDPNILVAENGAIDIRTGELLPHSCEYYCTTRVPYAYNPDAYAERWHHFLDDTLSPEVADFLQEFAGYCLTTDTSHEKAIWLVGAPGGGKSTFIEGLMAMLGGERAGVLGLQEIEKSRFSLAKLVGKTLVTAAEQPAGFLSCHHTLNAIISGEPIQVEQKYRNPYDFTPRAKIAWAMNELPRIPSGAEGLFRRVEVIMFPKIDENKRDFTLKEDIKKEGGGILNWALEGLHRLRERGGFEVPALVEEATAQFRENNDIAALFIEEECELKVDSMVRAKPLYSAYSQWCKANGHHPKSSTAVSEDWQRLGFQKIKRKEGNYYVGLELKDDIESSLLDSYAPNRPSAPIDEDATAQASEGNDTTALFIQECCGPMEDRLLEPVRLYSAYVKWCKASGYRAKSHSAVAEDWHRLGLVKVKRSDGLYYAGIGVADGKHIQYDFESPNLPLEPPPAFG